MNREIQAFPNGVENLLDDEIISQAAASDALNWISQDEKIQLIPGKLLIGQSGIAGKVTGEIFGYKVDGSKIHWEKVGTKIRYFDGTNWQDVVTGLTSNADYTFTNYASLAGNFTFAIGVDGIFKMNNANPANFIALYDASKNFKGYAFIDKGRMILWNTPTDKTGLYGSHIDPQNSTVYTSVSGEATTSLTGTLAFKAGNPKGNCFGITITITAGGEVYTDNYLGVLTGSAGGTGTINYITGAYTISAAGVGTASYQWENSNAGGVTDFTHSPTRLAAEGFVFRQDKGGDAILTVLVGSNGYYSIKSQSAYLLSIGTDDLTADNNVYREQMGVPNFGGALSTSLGIIFMNTANPGKPEMTILVKNLVDGTLEPKVLFPQFKFANYLYDDCRFFAYDRYILVACKTLTATNNDTILMCNVSADTVNITGYAGRTFASDGTLLYMGSSVVQSVYNLFSGFDDDGFSITNHWDTKGENFAIKSRGLKYVGIPQSLKKYRKIRLRGNIVPGQSYEVYANYDDASWQLVGTVVGTQTYVDDSNPATIGSSEIGIMTIGGNLISNANPYQMEIRLKKMPKFRKRKLRFLALGFGYVDIEYQADWDIFIYNDKLPTRFRQKQNVSLDGEKQNQDTPEF